MHLSDRNGLHIQYLFHEGWPHRGGDDAPIAGGSSFKDIKRDGDKTATRSSPLSSPQDHPLPRVTWRETHRAWGSCRTKAAGILKVAGADSHLIPPGDITTKPPLGMQSMA